MKNKVSLTLSLTSIALSIYLIAKPKIRKIQRRRVYEIRKAQTKRLDEIEKETEQMKQN